VEVNLLEAYFQVEGDQRNLGMDKEMVYKGVDIKFKPSFIESSGRAVYLCPSTAIDVSALL